MNFWANLSKSSIRATWASSVLLILGLGALPAKETNSTEIASDRVTLPTQAQLSLSTRPISSNIACFNVNVVRVKSWSDRDFWQGVNNLNPAMLRIPGGEGSGYWDWRKGGLVDDISELPESLPEFLDNPRDRSYNASNLDALSSAFQQNGKIPIFVLNMLSDSLESQLEMLRTAEDLGMPVKYIELGNEFYFPKENYRSVFPTIGDYTRTANIWISAIRKEFPQAKVAVLGVARKTQSKTTRIARWNKKIIADSLSLADAITIHTYGRNGLENEPITTQDYPYFETQNIPQILSQPFQNWQKVRDIVKTFPENKKVWVTEYNLMEDINATQGPKRQRIIGSWIHGLYTVSMSLLFLEDLRINIACNHMLIGSSQFSAILSNENSLIDPRNKGIKSEPFSLSATGYTQKLFREVTQEMTKAKKIHFNNIPTLAGKENFYYPSLYGWSFFNQKKEQSSLILNLSSQEIEVEIQDLFSTEAYYEITYGSPRDLVNKTGVLKQKTGKVTDKIVLPAYSATKISNKENRK